LVVLIGTASTRVMVNLSSSFGIMSESIKLIHSDKPSEALMRYYDAEKAGLVKCVEY